jgi:DNA invertase Pin-like site-specific DNA recombinase
VEWAAVLWTEGRIVVTKATTRCAIYTRKSTEEGLDQAFNSLHAQREACEAYIKSQAAEGWLALATEYDDGGFSGGNMTRPGLRRLLADVDAGLIDTVVVYKIDRLTRALSDFARIVERLDKADASFVSVTQAFNTTTSMGRLTLNVLLSFAQFEREVTGERIRDKIAMSKKKGMWMGGIPPLGYDLPTDQTTRALVVEPSGAERVRAIFQLYLEFGTVSAVEQQIASWGWRTRERLSRRGVRSGGAPYSRGMLFHLLKNRIYIGEIVHGDAAAPGLHPAIVDRALFDRVQQQLAGNAVTRAERPLRSADLKLKGKLFDADGHPMSPSFGYGRGGRVYRYYVSSPLQTGRHKVDQGAAIQRVTAETIHEVVSSAVQPRLGGAADGIGSFIDAVRRVEILADEVSIELIADRLTPAGRKGLAPIDRDHLALIVPVRCRRRGGRVEQILPPGTVRKTVKRDPTLIRGLQQSHRLAKLMGWRAGDGSVGDGQMKQPESAYERKLVRLAFLAPDIQRAILSGTQSPGITLGRLLHEPIPTDWADQRRAFA